MAERKFLIDFKMAPGDVSMLTAFVRDFKLKFGDKYDIGVRTNFPAIWRHNPYIVPLTEGKPGVETLYLGKKGPMSSRLTASNKQKIHFLRYFHWEFETKTGLNVPVYHPRPDIHLSEEEKKNPLISGRYWIIVPGGKLDMTNKIWSQVRYQQVVDKLRPWGLRFVQEGATKKLCVHPPLNNVLNMVGQTSIRDLIVNIHHAEGVICGVTFQMHLAAALNKPCVVLGGGRENPWWEAYIDDWQAFGTECSPVAVPHRYLHSIGLLPCCKTNGCWKQRVVRINDRTSHDNSLCKMPVTSEASQVIPKCLELITSDHVAEAVMSYYEDGTLKPIGKPTGKYSSPPRPVEQTTLLVNKQTAEDLKKFGEESPKNNSRVSFDGKIVDLFGGAFDKPAEPAQIEVDSEDDIGDVYTAEPQVVRQTELVQTGQANPDKGQNHAYPPPMQPSQPGNANASKPAPAPLPTVADDYDMMNDPRIGGKVTICVLLYGGDKDHVALHKRCLNSIVQTVPPQRMDLRVAMNQVVGDTQKYLLNLPISKTYPDYSNRRKYPAMREMFWDTVNPITTNYVIWFDDDSYARDPAWLKALIKTILAQPVDQRVGLFGQIMYHPMRDMGENQKFDKSWFEGAEWWKNRMTHARTGRPAPNGGYLQFVTGGFWAADMAAIKACNIPDPRLNHNGGDICIGTQIYQGGYQLKEFNSEKKFIHTSAAPRRGFRETFPWYTKK